MEIKVKKVFSDLLLIKDNSKVFISIKLENCLHINNGSWKIITE